MTAKEVRNKFFEFFESKAHKIVPSAPIVNKNDPTLMFTNAGMNQFKDYFLGNKVPDTKRIADTQKCLRVSGKHNDLEEVGIDSYHHTMFEMLGNWSFGDYFKKEAIAWGCELLIDIFHLPKERLYATVFGGDENEKLDPDNEAADIWTSYLPKDRILFFGKKDNFWEMGEAGPCGPCSEIHIDLRSEDDRAKIPGSKLVNRDHPEVIEIWNLVFIQYNRLANGSLVELPEKHVDTGMGFERLTMALQGKKSTYESDIFTPFISWLEKKTGKRYTNSYDLACKTDIAMRVIVDHIRAVSFTIADGELPSNTGAGYVIRRILRRAIRYYYSFLDVKEPLLYQMVDQLAERFKDVFPELEAQKDFVAKIIHEEEKSFLRTLAEGLKRLETINPADKCIPGKTAFELYDTYGFPIDLTRLIAQERDLGIDEVGFEQALREQKERSRADAKTSTGDWIEIHPQKSIEFDGYDHLEIEDIKLVKYRELELKNKKQYQLVLDKTPFYPEGGGQVGDTGILSFGAEDIKVLDTMKENDLIIHIVDKLPERLSTDIVAKVNVLNRKNTENNHTATHLMHAALREVLGSHVHQKGSLVDPYHLRFDFSHFQKVSDEEIVEIEKIVNQRIRENIKRIEDRKIPIDDARKSGAMMLFGEKYGDTVRMITFDKDYSVELCGGCHVPATGKLGYFKIIHETSVAAGVRRIEAVTASGAEAYLTKELDELKEIRGMFKNPLKLPKQVSSLQDENKRLRRELEKMLASKAGNLQSDLLTKVKKVGELKFLASKLNGIDSKGAKNLAYNLEKELQPALILLGIEVEGKPQLLLRISDELSKEGKYHAGNMIRDLAKHIRGGGGGQAFFATAGGSYPEGLDMAMQAFEDLLES
jgi:alanyl-tRNA synthetase